MLETRNILHSDGRLEIRRVISADNLDEWNQENPLAFERSIVWIRPVLDLPFVRTAFVKNARSRRGPLLTANEDQIVVGYSKLTADAPMQGLDHLYYQRRVFYLTVHDLQGISDVRESANCIQPSTIVPTIWGERFTSLASHQSDSTVVNSSDVIRDIREDSGIVEFAF